MPPLVAHVSTLLDFLLSEVQTEPCPVNFDLDAAVSLAPFFFMLVWSTLQITSDLLISPCQTTSVC
jgi:hypothetical protein